MAIKFRGKSVSSQNLFRVALLLLVTASLLALGVRLILDRASQQEDTPIPPKVANYKLLPIDDNTKLVMGGYRLTLPTSWTVSALLEDPTDTNYACITSDEMDCRLAFLGATSLDQKLQAITASANVAVKLRTEPDTIRTERTFKIAGIDVPFQVHSYTVTTGDPTAEELESEAGEPYQMYGCMSQLCYNVGPLSIDSEVNKLQVAEFIDYLTKVAYEKL